MIIGLQERRDGFVKKFYDRVIRYRKIILLVFFVLVLYVHCAKIWWR